ncbi:MAG: IS200/IS605 family transposase [Chloracidobacterium sp.]|nr:IS200/IS605 family transposase [Chloracidobacterium sp.]MCC6824394.1 IS200/IS605 family transposase [Acidobacteriota bacterium]MCO5332661.1 IS200/IS605 family transposase [Pyrinomonadaceae bacterium]
MSDSVYSEINLHITWHTKNNLPMITPRIEDRLYHFLIHKIIETPGAYLHAIGGIETHVHIGISLEPNILVSDWIGKLKGGSSYYINHEVQPKALEWQRGYGIVTFGTRDLQWVVAYIIKNQKEHHRKGAIHERLERITSYDAKAAREGR